LSAETATIQADSQPRRRCTVYIDGFNWYYAIFKRRPEWKWLNIQSFFDEIRPDEEVCAIKMFSAYVEPEAQSSAARDRQKAYFAALCGIQRVKIVLGKYQQREVTCRASCGMKYLAPEEKKTDVNIAVHILNDVVKGLTDSIAVVSGDSDLEPAIFWVKENYERVKITVYIPSLPEDEARRTNRAYGQHGIACRFLPLEPIPRHQLPPRMLRLSGGELTRPAEWCASENAA
jgi:uncharacterized LabA/DUF88 family protein